MRKKGQKLMGIPSIWGPQFLWSETRVLLPWGLGCLSRAGCCCPVLHRLGAGAGKDQSGESTQDRKQGVSSTFCLVGGPFLTPQTRNRALLFELPFHVCSVLLGFRLKDPIYYSSKKYEVPQTRPNKTSTKYLWRQLQNLLEMFLKDLNREISQAHN